MHPKKRCHFFILFAFVSFSIISLAQERATFEWAAKMGGAGSESGRGVTIDNSGNVITAGFFAGTADFDPGTPTFNLISAGSNDAFVAKLDANGKFIWAIRVGGTGAELTYAIKNDASGNLYVTGEFTGTVDFDPGTGSFPLTSAGSTDVFTLKLDTDGNFLWAKRVGSTGVDRPNSLSLDPAGDVYTTGIFALTVDFDPGTAVSNLTAAGSFESFVLKLDANGNFVWAAKLGANTATRDLTTDAGNVYVTGDFSGTADFDPGAATFNMTVTGLQDIFVTKLTNTGAFVWAKKMGGTDTETGETIAVDVSGNVYTSGGYIGTADFDPGAGTFNFSATSASIYDIFISKLDANGNFIWAKSMGSTGTDYGGCLAIDPSGDVYLTSEFQGTVDFDPNANYNTLTAAGSTDIVVQKLSAAGNYIWAALLGGTNFEVPHGMTLDASSNPIITGFFNNTADFDPTARVANLTAVANEVFIVKLSSEISTTIGETFDTSADGWTTVTAIGSPTPIYSATGGNPGGMIGAQDIPAGASLPLSYFRAPAGFIGNLCSSYGKSLTYDLQQTTSRAYVAAENVIISNGLITLEYNPTVQVYPAVAPGWTTYTVPLMEGPGWLNSSSGSLATQDEMKSVLCAVTRLDIRGRFGSTPDGFSHLDNVSTETLPTTPPPTITSFAPATAIPGSTVTIIGTGFEPTASNNTVFFGSIQATVTTASATQLQVVVPTGARFGTITILNNTTSLIGQTLQNFDPTFTDGGKIIPASLKLRQEINLGGGTNFSAGLSLADIDNDGWVDIITTESLGGISIFRNLGTGGSLAPASFAPKVTLTQANGKLRVGDMDGDGRQDIAVLYAITFGYVTIYRNTSSSGSISFVVDDMLQSPSGNIRDIQLTDLDSDGRLDLLESFFDGCSIGGFAFGVWQGISTPGNIEFCAYRNFDQEVFCNSNEITVGDFNNDNKPDVAVVNNSNSQFHILQNTSTYGVISFGTPFLVTGAVVVRGRIQVADFNNDNKPDLAWRSNTTNDVRIRTNTNTGGALTATDFATELILQSSLTGVATAEGELAVADINGDGKPDLVGTDDNDFGIFENLHTSGALTTSSFDFFKYQGPGSSARPAAPEMADLNGDSRPDIVFGTLSTATQAKIVISENINTHTPTISLTTVSPLKGPVGSIVTITGNYFSVTPSENIVYFGPSKATVLTATKNTLTVSVPPGATHAPVSVTCNQLTAQYHLPFNIVFSLGTAFSSSSFGPPVNFTLTNAELDLDVADLNGDNKPDVVAEGFNNDTYMFRNAHSGTTITTSSLIPDDTVLIADPRLLDLNGDSKPDLFGESNIFRNSHTTGNEISFDAGVVIGSNALTGFADLNLDGRMDLVGTNGANASAHENLSRLGFFTSGAFPTISSSSNFPKPATGGYTVAADFDNDGSAEIASTNPANDNFTVWRSNGGLRITPALFTSAGNITTGDLPQRIYTADLDTDGKMDLVVIYGSTGTSGTLVSVFHNQSATGTITFTRQDFTPGTLAGPSAIADLDGDGKPEIIVTHQAANNFTILKNNSTSGTINASSFASNTLPLPAPRAVATGDINSDGRLDLIFTIAPNALSVLENILPVAAISYTTQPAPTTVCEGTAAFFSVTATGDNNLQYQWQADNGGGFMNLANGATYAGVNTATLTLSNPTAALNGTLYRVLAHGDVTSDNASTSAALTVNPSTAPATTGNTGCASTSISVSASGGINGQYRWYNAATGGTPIAGEVNNTYNTPPLTTTTSYFVSIDNGSCESVRVEVIATVTPVPTAPTATGASRCSPGTVTLSASGGTNGNYRWYDVATGGTALSGEVNSAFTTPSLSAKTSYYVSIHDGTCESTRTTVTATVNTPPAKPVVISSLPINNNTIVLGCNETVTLSAPAGFSSYLWSGGETTQQITVTNAGVGFTVEATDSNGCSGTSDPLDVIALLSCNTPPVVSTDTVATQIEGNIVLNLEDLIADPDGNLDLTTLRVVTQPTSGATASINANNELIINYSGIAFSGTDRVTIEVCDMAGSCTQQEIVIEVVGDIEVYNAVSPNDDGKNDFLFLEYIDILQETRKNRVTIFNRWGDAVFEITDYNNTTRVFKGLNNNGNELPSATYFYRIDFATRKSKTGFLTLKR